MTITQGYSNPLQTEEVGPIPIRLDQAYKSEKMSFYTGTGISSIKDQIEKFFDGQEDFENKDAVDSKTVVMAESVARLLPNTINNPNIGATPQGEIDLDWSPSRDIVFVVCVSPDGKVAFVGSVEGVSLKAEYEIQNMDRLPDFIYLMIEYVGNMNER